MNSIYDKVTIEGRADMKKMWSDDEFNKELHSLVEMEQKVLGENPTNGVLPKMVVVCSKTGEVGGELEKAIVMMAIEDFNDSKVKERTFQGLGAKFGDEGFKVLCSYQISEAWVSMQRNEKDKVFTPPSQDPNRAEAIVVAGMTIDGRTNMAVVPFDKVGKEKVIFLKSADYKEYSEKGGNTIEANLLEMFFRYYILATGLKLLKGGKSDDKFSN